MYFMTNNFCGFKASLVLKKVRIMPLLGIFTMLFIFRVLDSLLVPSIILNTLNLFSLLALVWIFVEKEKVTLSLDEIILIWFLIYAFLHVPFTPILLVINVFVENEISLGIIFYPIMVTALLILCQKADLNKLLVFILRKTVFKILIFLTAMLFFIILLTLNNIRYLSEHSLIALPLLIPILGGLIHAIKLIHKNTTIIPNNYHDAKKLLMLLDIKAEKATDIAELKEMLTESIDLMKLELPHASVTIPNTANTTFEIFIRHTIESIKVEKKFNTKILSNIQFSEKYDEINDIKFAYMMGLLLEHALDTLTKRPIFIKITSSKHKALIRVSCEYKFKKNLNDLEASLLGNEAITHSKNHLLKLKSLIDEHNGQVTITREKNIQEQADYLSICLIFKKEGEPVE